MNDLAILGGMFFIREDGTLEIYVRQVDRFIYQPLLLNSGDSLTADIDENRKTVVITYQYFDTEK